MGVEDIEVQVGGVSLKGVWIALVIGFGSTVATAIWTASEFFSRLEAQEQAVSDAMTEARLLDARFTELKEGQNKALQDMQVAVSNMQTQLQDNNVAGLSNKLSELGASLAQIMEIQKDLLPIRDRISQVEKSNGETVILIDSKIQAIDKSTKTTERHSREIDDLWSALDSLFGQ